MCLPPSTIMPFFPLVFSHTHFAFVVNAEAGDQLIS